jgi:hypothetical protein
MILSSDVGNLLAAVAECTKEIYAPGGRPSAEQLRPEDHQRPFNFDGPANATVYCLHDWSQAGRKERDRGSHCPHNDWTTVTGCATLAVGVLVVDPIAISIVEASVIAKF